MEIIRSYHEVDMHRIPGTRIYMLPRVDRVDVHLNDKGEEVRHRRTVLMFENMNRTEALRRAEQFKNILNGSGL